MNPLHPDLNAYTLAFDPDILKPFEHAFSQQVQPFFENRPHMLEGQYYYEEPVGSDYFLFSYDTYPLFWVTNHSDPSYQLFHRLFEHLNLAQLATELLDCKSRAVMFCGFFVVGNQAHEKMWHYDYREDAQGMTLITPLFHWIQGHGHLLYQDAQKNTLQYRYRRGEAIVFGPGFMHSTEPYETHDEYRILLSMTLGSDKWEHWPLLERNIAEQSYYFARPCGHIVNRCHCDTGLFQRFQKWLNRQISS